MLARLAATTLDYGTAASAAIGYAGMALLAWAQIDHTCATVFIGQVSMGATAALGGSALALAIHAARRWSFGPTAGRRLLFAAAAPLVITSTFLVVAFGLVFALGPRH